MVDGKRYLIIGYQDDGDSYVKLAYWFDLRYKKYYGFTCPSGFYGTKASLFPYKHVIGYVAIDELPKFSKWKLEEPIEDEKYLVYRVGSTKFHPPHHTIRKYRNGSFGSKDVKYWIRLSEVVKEVKYVHGK